MKVGKFLNRKHQRKVASKVKKTEEPKFDFKSFDSTVFKDFDSPEFRAWDLALRKKIQKIRNFRKIDPNSRHIIYKASNSN